MGSELPEVPLTYTVHCYDCGRAYGTDSWIEAVVNADVWKQISPTHDEGGILCINCMAIRLARLGMQRVPVWLGAGPFVAAYLSEEENSNAL